MKKDEYISYSFEVKLACNKLHVFKVCNLINFNMKLWNHHYNQDNIHILYFQKYSHSLGNSALCHLSFLTPTFPLLQQNVYLNRLLCIPQVLCVWDNILYFLRLFSFSIIWDSSTSVLSIIYFYCRVAFHYMYVPQFVYHLLIDIWIFFPVWGFYK